MRPLGLFKRKKSTNDPAPSRAVYRFQRLWLTPLFRALLRTGVPAFTVVLAVVWYLGDRERLADLFEQIAEARQTIEERPEFMVRLMTIDGASEELALDIQEVLPIDLPVSQFALDLHQLKDMLEGLDPIAEAEVRLKPGGLLAINVQERAPAVIWQSETGFELLTERGHRVSSIQSRKARAELPVVAGRGASDHVPEALRLFEAAKPVAHEVVALVRVGERRWDLVLTGDRRVMLPESDPALALDRAIALHAAQDVLSRDVVALDYRNTLRPTVRMSQAAQEEWRRIKNLESKEVDG